MKKGLIFALIICILLLVIACVSQSIQLKGTWEFVGYKEGRVKSVIETDSTICFDGDGNGYYFQNDDSSISNYFTYLISNDHKMFGMGTSLMPALLFGSFIVQTFFSD